MVDVAHDGDHRRTIRQVILVTGVLTELQIEAGQQFAVLVLRADHLDAVVQLGTQNLEGLVRHRLGGGDHLAQVEQHLHQLRGVDVDLLGQVGQRRAAPQPDGLAITLPDPHATDRRCLHLIELLTTLLLRLAATTAGAGATEGALRAATATAATTTGAAGRATAHATGTTRTARAATATRSAGTTTAHTRTARARLPAGQGRVGVLGHHRRIGARQPAGAAGTGHPGIAGTRTAGVTGTRAIATGRCAGTRRTLRATRLSHATGRRERVVARTRSAGTAHRGGRWAGTRARRRSTTCWRCGVRRGPGAGRAAAGGSAALGRGVAGAAGFTPGLGPTVVPGAVGAAGAARAAGAAGAGAAAAGRAGAPGRGPGAGVGRGPTGTGGRCTGCGGRRRTGRGWRGGSDGRGGCRGRRRADVGCSTGGWRRRAGRSACSLRGGCRRLLFTFSVTRRTTGASIVEEADRTNSPISFRVLRSSLLSSPSSLASS